MAGEIEEPFRLNLQADLLHSGSISFGRFESESLSWERRSIFSHNRYLEEVEKYSKPGSVTEKKAYFEAEFKRKALLKQRSSECQESTTSRNNELHDFKEFCNGSDSSCGSYPSECNIETETQQHAKGDVEALYTDNGNERLHNSGYDESQSCEFFPVAVQDESVVDLVNYPVNVPEHVKLDEIHQSETDNVASKADDSFVTCQTPKKDEDITISGPRTMFSSKVKPASEKRITRATFKTQVNVDRFQKHGSNETSKCLVNPSTSERKGLLVNNTEKKSPRPASLFACSGVKTSKTEDATRLKEKDIQIKKSIVKDLNSEKAVKSQLPGVRSAVNRSKQAISSSKAHVIQNAAGFSLKTDKRTENRKEEKQAAEMKQFRRSLIFKAKPMPSFYNESARGLDQHKVTPNQPRPSSQSVATRRDKNTIKSYSVPLNIRPSSSTSLTNRVRLPETSRKYEHKNSNLNKQKDLESRLMKKNAKGIHMGSTSRLLS